jgi:bleomycin hydrolase
LVLRKAAKGLSSQGVSDDHVLAALRAKKEQLMAETYRILTAMLGAPLS